MSISRRSFLKLSLGGLLAAAVNTNPVLSAISNSVSESPYKVFLYLIQTKEGKWKVKGTTCINVDSTQVNPFKFNVDTFKPLGVYSADEANDKKLQYWNQYKCGKGFQKVNYQIRINNGIKAKKTGQLKSICNNGKGGIVNRDNKHGLFSLTPEQKSEFGIKGGKASISNLLKWCEENNHWDNLPILQKGYEKSEEHKQKLSDALKGRTLSEETKKKMSESRTGMKFTEERKANIKKAARKRMRPVIQYDLNGSFIKEWGGFAEIVDELKVSKSPIYVCCKGNTKKAHGFIWKYKEG